MPQDETSQAVVIQAPQLDAAAGSLPGTVPALEPGTETVHPLRAQDVPALLPKVIA